MEKKQIFDPVATALATTCGVVVLGLCLYAARIDSFESILNARNAKTWVDVTCGFTVPIYVLAKGIYCAMSLWLQSRVPLLVSDENGCRSAETMTDGSGEATKVEDSRL